MRTKAPSLSTDGKSAGFSVAERQAIMEVMEISPRTQALMLLLSAAVGAAAGLVFDLITVFIVRWEAAARRGTTKRHFLS